MVDGVLFDKLSKIGGMIRGRPDEPFGGIQVRIGLRVLVDPSDYLLHVGCHYW